MFDSGFICSWQRQMLAMWHSNGDSTVRHTAAYGEKKDLSKLRTFGCKVIMYLENLRRDGPGRFADRGVEGINLGLGRLAIEKNTSGYKIYIPKERVIRVNNQVTF